MAATQARPLHGGVEGSALVDPPGCFPHHQRGNNGDALLGELLGLAFGKATRPWHVGKRVRRQSQGPVEVFWPPNVGDERVAESRGAQTDAIERRIIDRWRAGRHAVDGYLDEARDAFLDEARVHIVAVGYLMSHTA